MNQSLLSLLEDEIKTWILSSTFYFTNERDLQVKLAKHLEDSRKFDRVYTEYRVPLAELKHRGIPVEPNPKLASARKISPSFPWNNHLSIDIVVESNGQFAAIELKYATKPINEKENLFGEDLIPETKVLINDVIAGARIGLLSARIGYWMLPLYRKWFKWDKGSKDVAAIAPICDLESRTFGLSMGMYFRLGKSV